MFCIFFSYGVRSLEVVFLWPSHTKSSQVCTDINMFNIWSLSNNTCWCDCVLSCASLLRWWMPCSWTSSCSFVVQCQCVCENIKLIKSSFKSDFSSIHCICFSLWFLTEVTKVSSLLSKNKERQTLSLHYVHIWILVNKIFNMPTSLVVQEDSFFDFPKFKKGTNEERRGKENWHFPHAVICNLWLN
jgi:hypothetical protein